MMRKLSILANALVLAAVPMAAEPAHEAAPIAAEQLGGTLLTVAPQIAYDTALLRVAGPDGYALTKQFVGRAPIAVDLVTEAEPRSERLNRRPMTGREAGPALPDGKYHWELVMESADGVISRAGGTFFGENGVAVSRRAKRSELAGVREQLAQTAAAGAHEGIGEEGYQTSDYITIDGNNPRLGLSDDDPSNTFMAVQNYNGSLRLKTGAGAQEGTPHLTAVSSSGFVGIGAAAPQRQLHVDRGSGLQLRLSSYTNFTDLDLFADSFAIAHNHSVITSPQFLLFSDAPHNALVIRGAGIGVGTDSPSAKLHVAGNGRIDGDVALGSSRTLKTAFDAVDPAEMLAKVADLPLASWRYKTEDEDARHIGPFAEDFQRLFGLGDGETISVIDAQGVTLAAIQGLQQELADKDAEIAALRQADAERKAQLAGLREQVEALTAALASR